MCVCSGACLHSCMYMSRTHNTNIHSHTPRQGFSHACLAWVHVYTAVCTCHAHTTLTYTQTQHTHLFRSLCLHFGCMRTPGVTACRHLHSTGPRSRVRFFVKLSGACGQFVIVHGSVCVVRLVEPAQACIQRDTLSEATVTLRTVVTFVTWNRVSSLESVL